MRVTAGLLMMIAGLASAPEARAQTALSGPNAALFQAVFAAPTMAATPFYPPSQAQPNAEPAANLTAAQAASAPVPSGAFVLPGVASLIVDGGRVSQRSFVRHWPAAVSLTAGGYDLALSPHAGVGVGDDGDAAEAGATLSLGSRIKDDVIQGLNHFGVRTVDEAKLKDRSRWFLFAAASGSAVGLNIARDAQGHYQRLGWSAEGASALISDAQAGVAWRRGDTQASLGYVHRDIQGDFAGVASGHFSDSMVAFSISIHPQ